MNEYNFEEERGDRDFDYDDRDLSIFDVTPEMEQDWAIHNDHQEDSEDNEEPIEPFAPCWNPSCMLEVCSISEHYLCSDEELDRMFVTNESES